MITQTTDRKSHEFLSFVADALCACHQEKQHLITLPAGTHYIFPDELPEKYCSISNHDSGLKRLLFDLEGLENIEIDGNGAELILHGEIIPFYLKGCKNVTIRNLKIDWARTFLSQTEIISVGEGALDLQFDVSCPAKVEGDRLVFYGECFHSTMIDNFLEFDVSTRAPAAGAFDNFGVREGYRAEALGDGQIRLLTDLNPQNAFKVGNLLVIKHSPRNAPAIVIADSASTTLRDIDIYHSGGMGVIAQTSRDIDISQVRVAPRPGSNRVFSVFVDAFHFVDCSGNLNLDHCVMIGQMDDAVNIHGVFLRVDSLLAPNKLRLQLMHHQQFGIQTIDAGDVVGFFDENSLKPLVEAKVIRSTLINQEILEVEFEDLPEDLPTEQLLAMRVERDFQVNISNCHMRDNRSRGVLFNAYGSCHIRDCYFRTPWEAVRVSGAVDGKWYESGPSDHIEVSGCHFDHCGYATGRAVIHITAHNCPDGSVEPYHQKQVLSGNEFQLAHPVLIAADNTGLLEFYDNSLHPEGLAQLVTGENVGLGRLDSVEHVQQNGGAIRK